MRGFGAPRDPARDLSLHVSVLAGPLKGTVVLPVGSAGDPAHATHWRWRTGAPGGAPAPRSAHRDDRLLEAEAPASDKAMTAVMEVVGYRFDRSRRVMAGDRRVQEHRPVGHVIYDKQKVSADGAIKPGESRKQKYQRRGEYELREESSPTCAAT